MVNMQNNYNQLMDIAKSAYGSGAFEGSNGGNGYVGQYTDAEGKAHVVKVLTHRNERNEYAQNEGRRSTDELAAATQQLKANLIAIADGANPQLGATIRKMLEDAQAKAVAENMTAGSEGAKVGLLSRKIVAKAVTTIAKDGHVKDDEGRAFSWNAVNDKNRAATVEDTKANTVNAKLVCEHTLADVFSIEDKFRQMWHHPLENGMRGGDVDVFGFAPFASRFRAMDSAYADTDGSKPCGQRLKDLAKMEDFNSLAMITTVGDKLRQLDDDMTAKEALEKLREFLDVDAFASNQGCIALRVLLEKLVLAEARGNLQPAAANLQNGNHVRDEIPQEQLNQNNLPPQQENVPQEPSKQENVPQEPPKQENVPQEPPKQPSVMPKLPDVQDVGACKTLEELKSKFGKVFGEKKTQFDCTEKEFVGMRTEVVSAVAKFKIAEYCCRLDKSNKTNEKLAFLLSDLSYTDLVNAKELDKQLNNPGPLVFKEGSYLDVIAKVFENSISMMANGYLEDAKLPAIKDVDACETLEELQEKFEKVFGDKDRFNCTDEELADVRFAVASAIAKFKIAEFREKLNKDDASYEALNAKMGKLTLSKMHNSESLEQLKDVLRGSSDEKLFGDLVNDIWERVEDWAENFRKTHKPALPNGEKIVECKTIDELGAQFGKVFRDKSEFQCTEDEIVKMRRDVMDWLFRLTVDQFCEKLDLNDPQAIGIQLYLDSLDVKHVVDVEKLGDDDELGSFDEIVGAMKLAIGELAADCLRQQEEKQREYDQMLDRKEEERAAEWKKNLKEVVMQGYALRNDADEAKQAYNEYFVALQNGMQELEELRARKAAEVDKLVNDYLIRNKAEMDFHLAQKHELEKPSNDPYSVDSAKQAKPKTLPEGEKALHDSFLKTMRSTYKKFEIGSCCAKIKACRDDIETNAGFMFAHKAIAKLMMLSNDLTARELLEKLKPELDDTKVTLDLFKAGITAFRDFLEEIAKEEAANAKLAANMPPQKQEQPANTIENILDMPHVFEDQLNGCKNLDELSKCCQNAFLVPKGVVDDKEKKYKLISVRKQVATRIGELLKAEYCGKIENTIKNFDGSPIIREKIQSYLPKLERINVKDMVELFGFDGMDEQVVGVDKEFSIAEVVEAVRGTFNAAVNDMMK